MTNLVDIMIRCAEEEFRCHPFILATHINFYQTMFTQTGFKEGASREDNMKDILLTTLKEVISDSFDEKTDISALFDAAH